MKRRTLTIVWWFAILTLGGHHVQYMEYRSYSTCQSVRALYLGLLGSKRVSDCVSFKGEELIGQPIHEPRKDGV